MGYNCPVTRLLARSGSFPLATKSSVVQHSGVFEVDPSAMESFEGPTKGGSVHKGVTDFMKLYCGSVLSSGQFADIPDSTWES